MDRETSNPLECVSIRPLTSSSMIRTGILEKRMETLSTFMELYRGNIGVYWDVIGIMGNKMETIGVIGIINIAVILGIYSAVTNGVGLGWGL